MTTIILMPPPAHFDIYGVSTEKLSKKKKKKKTERSIPEIPPTAGTSLTPEFLSNLKDQFIQQLSAEIAKLGGRYQVTGVTVQTSPVEHFPSIEIDESVVVTEALPFQVEKGYQELTTPTTKQQNINLDKLKKLRRDSGD